MPDWWRNAMVGRRDFKQEVSNIIMHSLSLSRSTTMKISSFQAHSQIKAGKGNFFHFLVVPQAPSQEHLSLRSTLLLQLCNSEYYYTSGFSNSQLISHQWMLKLEGKTLTEARYFHSLKISFRKLLTYPSRRSHTQHSR